MPRRHSVFPLAFVAIAAMMLAGCSGKLGAVTSLFGGVRSAPTVITVSDTNPAQIATTSQNWSGYTIAMQGVTMVSASWQVPQVTGGGSSDASTWVGIGGIASKTLIQAGTDELLHNGSPQYSAWIEMLPNPPQTLNELDILPGDHMTVSITNKSGNTWSISLKDSDAKQSLTRTVTYTSCECSAEWIEEAPSVDQHETVLANFTSVTFTNMAATLAGQAADLTQGCQFLTHRLHSCPLALRMTDAANRVLAQPQEIQNGSFSVVYIDRNANAK
jgi:hypothetical protein